MANLTPAQAVALLRPSYQGMQSTPVAPSQALLPMNAQQMQSNPFGKDQSRVPMTLPSLPPSLGNLPPPASGFYKGAY